MEIRVREAIPSDAAALAAIGTATSPQHEMDVVRYAEDIARHLGLVYLAEVKAVAAGYLMLRTENHPEIVEAQSPMQLWRIYVLPEFHGKGVAAALMSRALDHARRGEHDVIWLGVSEHNDRAIAFYGKQGFRALGMHRLHGGAEPHDDVIMSRLVRRVPEGNLKVKRLVPIVVVALLVWAGTTYYERTIRTRAPENTASVLPLAGNNQVMAPIEEKEQVFACDGREYCSQMTSCEEAEYFLANCPNVKMDGGGDGVPCERQWCKN